MREMMKMSVVCVMAILVCFGCTKKAKVNLDGLDQNPAGAVQDGEGGNGTAGNGFGGGFGGANDPFVVPVANTNGNGIGAFDPNAAGNNGIGGNGTWSDMVGCERRAGRQRRRELREERPVFRAESLF